MRTNHHHKAQRFNPESRQHKACSRRRWSKKRHGRYHNHPARRQKQKTRKFHYKIL